MRGAKKVQKVVLGGRRFKDSKDDAHRKRVAQLRCAIVGKTCTETKWKGVYPNTVEVTETYMHTCDGWPIDPHHSKKKARGGHDRTCVPLCRAAHDEADNLTNEAFRQKWGVDLKALARWLSNPQGNR